MNKPDNIVKSNLTLFTRYLNCPIRYTQLIPEGSGVVTRKATLQHLAWMENNPSHWKDAKLVLRRVSTMTSTELEHAFRLAVHNNVGVSIEKGPNYWRIGNIGSTMDIMFDGRMKCLGLPNDHTPWNMHVAPVVNYLRSIGIDVDNFIEGGLAVEE